ncbi:unnamed protein product [Penicillium bialowiezense]
MPAGCSLILFFWRQGTKESPTESGNLHHESFYCPSLVATGNRRGVKDKAPSDPCWPTTEAWSSLNETVSGRLIKTVPPGSVCYKSEPNYNKSSCEYLLENWVNSEYHSSNPVTVSDPLWSNSSCTPVYPNGTSVSGDINAGFKGCSLGNLSAFVVNATTAQHVKAAIQFATKHNVRLNIKNTGHNPEKRSVEANSAVQIFSFG